MTGRLYEARSTLAATIVVKEPKAPRPIVRSFLADTEEQAV